ncbi:uncharacterized protein [Haliotis cracherodii]|uniref:uncharacterized protein n=1 Tax=Haliotis cracherodii TaxID=6455 RepID=UPI0039E9CD73
MPVVRLLCECEGVDPEVKECFPTEPTGFHNAVPNFVTIKPTPIRPQPPFQSDFSKEDTQQAKEHELRVQLMAALAEVDILRSDLQKAQVCSKCLQTEVRQLSDQKDSLREQVQRLVEEVDMLKGKGQCVHSGQGEGVELAQMSRVTQTTCFGQAGITQNITMSHGPDKLILRRQLELSQSNLSKQDFSSSSTHLIENCNKQLNVQKSKSFFSGLTKMFRRHRS